MKASRFLGFLFSLLLTLGAAAAHATTFTMTVPGTSLVLPADYPQAGGVAIVMVGANGNAYYQFSNPTGAFVGYNNSGTPVAFQGNPFTINSPIALNCGFSACSTYFGGSIARVYIRFTALDGDTQVGGFDFNDITLRLNGFDVANWSTITTQTTNTAGTTALSTQQGFGNNTFDTGWFQSTNPALLANILSTGRTTAQVFDRDPNDNYWDFRQGGTLSNNNIITVAPGYSLSKTASPTTFTAVGQVINYSYVVTNIGSVPIRSLTVTDDKIASVTCNKSVILSVPFGSPTPDSATCTGTYTVTQADFDAERVTNIAQARGVPDFGTLGGLTATATVTGPTINPSISLQKTSTLTGFGAVGTTVPYSFRVQNTGNATLTNVVVTDPKVPALSCTFATMAPGAVQTCTANYTVRQVDLDAFAAGTNLVNTASVTSRDPKNVARTATSAVSLPGPTPVLTMFVDKTSTATTYNAVGQVLPYQILVRNTGNITWPAAPTVADTKTTVSCPAGAVAPGASITCTANYTVVQADLDSGTLPNTATGSITVGSRTATANDTVTLTATRTTGLTIDKRLATASPTSFNDTAVALTYAYDLVNTGNVTLNTVAVTDNKVAVTCPAATLAPAATMTCTSAAYATTQADLNAGSVVNVASASATAAGTNAAVTSATDTVTVPAVQQPALTLAKTAPVVAAPQFVVGGVVTYSFDVTNSGNTDIPSTTQITVTDDKIGTFNCGSGVLLRNATRTCTATYTLTEANILAGLVVNIATAAAGPVTSNQVTATISPTLAPAITLVKSASPANIDATTDVITYTFTITNTGDSQIIRSGQPITVNDPMVGAVDCSAQPGNLKPTKSFTCTATYSATQAQLNAGEVVNSATASFPFTSGGTTTTITAPTSAATVPVIETTGLTLDKTGPATFTSVGQVISYGFSVTNNGNTTLTSTTVTDPKMPTLSCTLANVAPGATQSCTGNYTVTQADMDAGSIVNTATAQGRTQSGGSATDTDDVTVPVSPTVTLKSATLVKDASRTTFTAVGNTITYTMRVANTGAQTLRNITVTDVLDAGFSCAIPAIAPGVTNSDCTFTHTVTQAEFDAGQVVNTASAASPDFTTLTASRAVTGPARTANFTLVKSASGPFTAAAQTVTFTFTLTNTGNVSLSNLQVTDPFFSPSLSCTVPSLLPGATNATCTGSYLVTQADVDRGSITNTATAAASAPAGVTAPTNKTSTVVVNGPTRAPAVQIIKTPSATTYAAVSDVITYVFAVTNTGNVTLANLTVTDSALGFSCALDNLAPGASTTTCAGGAPALSDSKTIAQADIDLGTYSNTARVAGQSLIGAVAVSDTDAVIVTGPVQAPAINLVKETTLVGTFDSVGQVVPYTYTIQNTGNITLTGTFAVSDDKIAAVTCPTTPVIGLAPLATLTCTGFYTITQADLNANEVVNVATASTSQPVIPANPGDPAVVALTDTATETVLADQLPALSLEKRVKASSLSSYAEINDPVTFEYVVTNTGNVTTTGPITIADDKIPGSLSCGAAGIAPGGTFTCEQVWLADQAALDAGEVTNSAVASMVFDGAPVDSAADTATVTAVQDPKLAIVKTFTGTTNAGSFNVNDILSYSFVITNNGNVTIDGPLTLTDSLTSPVCPALPGNQLAPDATLTCLTTHTVTQNDIDLGAATNVVTVMGSFDGAPVVSPSDDAIYPLDAEPALSLTKTAISGAIPFAAEGDKITYRYSIDNTGNVGLTQALYITDDKLGGGPRLCRAAAVFATTDPAVTCDFEYTVTQADVDRGFVTNNAVASTVYAPSGPATNVVSPNAFATVDADEDPELTVVKAVTAGPSPAAVGDSLTYTITTTNTGNQTISGVAVSDAKVGLLTCTVGGAAAPANVVLLPNAALVCQATYTVTQQDVDDQVLTNVADARGSDPQGATQTATDSVTHPLVAPSASVEVTKAVTPEPGPDDAFSAVGQPVTFAVTVRNTGNVTLDSTTVTDDLLPTESCAVPSLAPGQVYTGCTFTVIATQADIDALYGPPGAPYGGIDNTVTAVSQPANPGATTVSDTGNAFAKGPTHEPALTLAKSAVTTTFDAFGDTITYEFIVANAGNITLTADLMVNDPLLGAPFACGPLPAAGLPPREFVTCTRTYSVTQADVDAGVINNTATVSSTEAPLPTDPAALAKVTSSAEVTGTRTPAVTVEKLASITADAQVGDVITYDYTVTNSGNVTLTNVALDDQHTSAAGTVALTIGGDAAGIDAGESGNSTDATADGVWDNLGPGDSATFTALYTVTQADIDAGDDLSNTVTVTTNSPSGTTAPTASDTVDLPVEAADPSILALKIVDETGLSTPPVVGDELAYTITVENTGNVTLSAVTLTDDLQDAGGNPITPILVPVLDSGDTDTDSLLDVGETWTYLVTYTLTQAAIDAGGVSNSVEVDAEDPFGTPVTETSDDDGTNPDDRTTTTFTRDPLISVVKTAVLDLGANTRADAGDTITYEYVVSNDGNVTLFDLDLTETAFTGTGPVPVPVLTAGGAALGGAAGVNDLAVGSTATFSVVYTLTQADVDVGQVDNQATVTADDPTGTELSDLSGADALSDTITETPLSPAAGMEVLKIVDATGLSVPPAVGDVLRYTVTVENTGNVTLSELGLTDDFMDATGAAIVPTLVPVLDSGDDGDGLLQVGEVWTYVVDYTLTQSAIDAGGVSNSVTAAAKAPDLSDVSDVSDDDRTGTDDPTETPFAADGALTVGKTVDTSALSANPVAGETLTYEITIANSGNVTLTTVALTDTLANGDAGAMTLTTGPILVSGDTGGDSVLSVGETWVYTATYDLTQADIDSGLVTNTAEVAAETPAGASVDDAANVPAPLTRAPQIASTKSATPSFGADGRASPGDRIDYVYTVTNTGNVTVYDITVTESGFTGTGIEPVPVYATGGALLGNAAAVRDLAVGRSLTFTAQYVLTQADVDEGFVDNQADTAATPPTGPAVTDVTGATDADDDVTRTLLPASPFLEVVKTADVSGLSSPAVAGDAVGFEIVVSNTGNVSLSSVVLTETFTRRDGVGLSLAPVLQSGDGGVADVLEVGEVWTYAASHVLTQDDIDAGGVANSVEVASEAPGGAPVSDVSDDGDDSDGNMVDDPTVVAVGGVPAVSMVKALAAGSTAPFDRVGQVLDYSFTVTNDGNITLTAPIVVSDPLIEDAGGLINCPVGPVAPGASVICTGSYTVTQEDLDAGSLTNTAAVAVSQPVVPVNPGDPVVAVAEDDSDPVVAVADQGPELSLDKRLATGSATSFDAVGDVVRFEYALTNTGNVTLAGPLSVTDDKIAGVLACGAGPLAPGATTLCAQDWVATQADLDEPSGAITNIASGLARFDGADVPSNTDSVTITAVQDLSLAIAKTLTGAVPDTFDVGTVLSYGFVITNDGTVTIDGPITVADSLSPVSCDPVPATGLAPGATLDCTSSYTLRAGDIALGSTTNLASATGSFGGADVTSPTDDAIYPVGAAPVLTLVKDSVPADASFVAVDDVVSYSYTVTNTGRVGLTEDIVITDNRLAAPFVCRPASAGVFGAEASVTCTAEYTVTQADLDAGFVTNEAIASTVFAPGTADEVAVSSPAATKTVPAVEEPELTVAKVVTAGANPAALGDVVSYRITATNTGNQTLRAVSVSDSRIAGLACTVEGSAAGASVTLAPDAALVCVGDYTVTQGDVNAQSLTNVADATGNDPQDQPITGTDSVNHPITPADPVMTVVKSLVPNPGTGPAFTAPGEVLSFAVTVTNDGNVTLTDLTVTDDLVAGECSIASLAPGASDSSCRFSYTTTQADVDALFGAAAQGGFVNTATVVATPANPGAADLTVSDTLDVLGPVHAPAFEMVKVADVATAQAFGDVITYTYTVTNSGNTTLLAAPVVVDDKISTVSCPALGAGGLLPGASIDCTASYSVTQADVDAGFVTNIASVTSAEVTTPAPATATVPITRAPELSVTKTASITADAVVGDVIDYSYVIENTGNTLLTAVTLDDQHSSAAGTVALAIAGDALATDAGEVGNSTDAGPDGIWDQLGPGDVVTFTASYTVTQADIDAGQPIANTVTVSATTPEGPLPIPGTDTVTIPLTPASPFLEVVKTADVSGLSSPAVAGDAVAYTITVRNTGNATLLNLGLSDTLLRADGTVLALTAGPTYVSGDVGVIGPMERNEIRTYSARYTLTQADIDAGGISNQARATAVTTGGTTVTDLSDDGIGAGSDDPTRTVFPATAAIVAEKTIVAASPEVGGTVQFLITAANTGNVTLRTVGVASDTLRRADGTLLTLTSGPSFRGSTLGSSAGVLLPGEVASYLATHVLTQADLDAGGISNTATVTGTPPVGPVVADVSDNGDDTDGNTIDDLTELTIPTRPGLALVKRLADGSGPSFRTVGQTLSFDFTATNTGNVTLAGPVSVNDPMIAAAGGLVTCPAGPLVPKASLTCTGSYTVTQADIDSGQIINTATASADGTVTGPASVTVLAVQEPALTTVKTAQALPQQNFVVGAQVGYTYLVTNSGNVSVTSPISVSDNRIAANEITCPALPAGGLAPAASLTCTATYTVTADDVDLGLVTNLATATDGTTISPIATETIPDNATPTLTVVKTAASGADFTAVGDVISYSYAVTNAGTRSFVNPVSVTDDKLGDIACFAPSGADPDLRPGETVTCTASHVVTQEDLDLGRVVNQAFATTTFGPNAVEVTSAPDTVTVEALLNPELSLTKIATPNPVTSVGQVVTYAFNVVNSGNQALRNIVVIDPMLPGLSCQVSRLLPGQSLQCEAPYTVTQADVDRGSLINTATAEAITPNGSGVEDSATATTTLPTAEPAVSLEKQAIPSPFGAAGSTLTYGFSVTNTGNVTLTDLVVTDPMDPAFSCTIARLAPLASNETCQFAITVTQAQVDAGNIANTANLTANTPTGGTITADDSIVTSGPAAAPGIEATKILLSSGSGLGDELRYQLLVRNIGGVTLTPMTPVDTMTRLDGTPTALDTAFTLVSGDANTNGLLELAEVWIYQGTHILTQEDLDAGGLSNSASISAGTPDGGSVSDVSDNGNDADGNTTDDPTVFIPQTGPALEVTKTVTATAAAVGETVSFRIAATNTGGVTLSGLTITDQMQRLDGTAITGLVLEGGVATLAPGEVGVWTLNHVLTQADVDSGGIQNSATVTGTGPDGRTATDISDNGNDADGNITDDATVVSIVRGPDLTVLKTLDSIGTAAGEEAIFTITATNTGNLGLTDIVLSDTLHRLDGTVLPSPTPVFVSNSGGSVEGSLLPAEVATWTVSYLLTQEDIDAGGLSNSATATAITPLGGSISDVSDDDGTGTSDPTLAPVDAMPTLVVTKSASVPEMLFPTVQRVTFSIDVQNTGNVTATGLRVVDDLRAFLAPATLVAAYPVTVTASGFGSGTANAAYDGVSMIQTLQGDATLVPGATGRVEITLVYTTAAGVPAGANIANASSTQDPTPVPSNPVTVVEIDSDGDGISDEDEGTGDRDGDGIPDNLDYDPTGTFYCEDTGQLRAGGQISVTGPLGTQTGVGTSNNINIVQDGTDGRFQFFVTAAGSYVVNVTYPPGTLPSTTRLDGGALDLTTLLPANPASIGAGEVGATGVLGDFSAGANPFFLTFVVEAGDPHVINVNIPIRNCGAAGTNVTATKTADRSTAVFGETVNYTLTFVNTSALTFNGASILDILPTGLTYTPGSGTVNGVATAPTVTGQQLAFGPLNVAPADTVVVRLAARVTGDAVGEMTNRAVMLDAGGVPVSSEATATIRILPEAVFECTDIIGKVYDDINRNGHPDGRSGLEPLTNDDIYTGGKLGKLSTPQPATKDNEPGLPGVRLVTANGLLITTDAFGRFHVPCAAMPRDAGSNFILKLDTRTLPQGYMTTTENPRVLRVTPGKVAKMNFGAALANVIDIDLTAAAFDTATGLPGKALSKAIKDLVRDIKTKPTALHLTYQARGGETTEQAMTRLKAAEKALRKAWFGVGAYRLDIERSVRRVQ